MPKNQILEKTFDMFWETDVPENELIISRTDLKGTITYANETFAKISGYSVDELIGKPHNIIRHPDMPKSIFENLWSTIKQGKKWEGYIKNLRKDKGYYWVKTEISGIYKNGKLIGYKSMRYKISDTQKRQMQNLYDKIREEEEGIVRLVIYTKKEVYEKLEELSKKLNKHPVEIVEEAILNFDYIKEG
ncbi:MAG: PAS domain-containing protein [Aquificae bacterium]|nr:PAS domain-containing protein [Aquificota bacterium]